ncbi:hypothetical protein NPIL_420141 [Nephila pilipes]|uniref:Retrovirus-related Pol polyprotein from transposon TNT 1-94 n=1 Tax=Nephila pilipes TaxID=299642 RepID=A0A8X6ITF5_NEPPI|nr:hypothetical protein NPIL_420141 [Nephila pilipes]
MLPDKSVCHHASERPRISRTGQRGRPRKEYGQVSITTDCFETSPSVQEALTGPNKTAWEKAMKEEHDALIKENAWTCIVLKNYLSENIIERFPDDEENLKQNKSYPPYRAIIRADKTTKESDRDFTRFFRDEDTGTDIENKKFVIFLMCRVYLE